MKIIKHSILVSVLLASLFPDAHSGNNPEITYGNDRNGRNWVLYEGKSTHVFCRCPGGELLPLPQDKFKKVWDNDYGYKVGKHWNKHDQCPGTNNSMDCPPPNYDQLARKSVCDSFSSPQALQANVGCGDPSAIAEAQNSEAVQDVEKAIRGAQIDRNTTFRQYRIDGPNKSTAFSDGQPVSHGEIVGGEIEFGRFQATRDRDLIQSVSVPLPDGTFAIFCQCLGKESEPNKTQLFFPDQPTERKYQGKNKRKNRAEYCNSEQIKFCPVNANSPSLESQIGQDDNLQAARDQILKTLHMLNLETNTAYKPIPPTTSGTPRLCAWSKGFESIEGGTVLPTVAQVEFGNSIGLSKELVKADPIENFCSRASTCVGQAVCTPNTVFSYEGNDYNWESIGRSNGVSSNEVFTADPIEYPESFDLYHVVCRGDQCNQQAAPKKLFDATSTHTNCSFSKVF